MNKKVSDPINTLTNQLSETQKNQFQNILTAKIQNTQEQHSFINSMLDTIYQKFFTFSQRDLKKINYVASFIDVQRELNHFEKNNYYRQFYNIFTLFGVLTVSLIPKQYISKILFGLGFLFFKNHKLDEIFQYKLTKQLILRDRHSSELQQYRNIFIFFAEKQLSKTPNPGRKIQLEQLLKELSKYSQNYENYRDYLRSV